MEETQPLTGGDQRSQYVKEASREARSGFVRKVYGILSTQLLLTTAIAAPICFLGPVWAQQNAWVMYLSMAGLIITFCSMICCANALRTFPTNYLFLAFITVVMSILVGFTSAMYTPQSVLLAAGITTAIFILMTIYAWTTTTDFTGFGPYLFAGLMVLMVFGFAISILGFMGVNIQWAMMAYNVFGVMLFTFYIVFDTQLIMGELGGHKVAFTIDDYCFAALTLYLDIINLFLHILRLMGDRR